MSWPRLLTQTHYRLRLAPGPPTFRIHWSSVVGEPGDDSRLTSRIKPLTKEDNWKMGLRPVAIDNANEKGRDALLNILRAARPCLRSLRCEALVLMNAPVSMMDSGWGWSGALMRWLTLWGLMRGWRGGAKWLDFCSDEHRDGSWGGERRIHRSQLFGRKDTKLLWIVFSSHNKEEIRCVLHCSFVSNILEGWLVIDADAPQCS